MFIHYLPYIILNLILVLLLFLKDRNKKKKEKSIANYLSVFDDYTRITNILTSLSQLEGIKRSTIVRVNNSDVKYGSTNKKYFINILFSQGEGATQLKNSFTYFNIDEYYSKFINDIKGNEVIKVIVADLPECELKYLTEMVGIEEFYAFRLIQNKSKLIYCTVSAKKIGGLNKYAVEIDRVRMELKRIIERNF